MLELIAAYLGQAAMKAGIGIISATSFVFVLGLFRKTSGYKKMRNASGKGARILGRTVSRVMNKKFPILWEPIEAPILDFCVFWMEQIAVGAREDNIEKLEDQAERLEGVNSETRLEGIREKIQDVKLNEAIEADPIKWQADAFGQASAADKLRE